MPAQIEAMRMNIPSARSGLYSFLLGILVLTVVMSSTSAALALRPILVTGGNKGELAHCFQKG